MGAFASAPQRHRASLATSAAEPPQTVLVAVDGSQHSQRALEWYRRRAARPNDDIVLLHAAGLPLYFGAPTGDLPSASDVDLALEGTRYRVTRLREAMLGHCDSLAVRCRFRFVESLSPGAAIVAAAEAEGAGLVVVGTRGLGTVRRTLLGSVSDYVITHSRVPVLVVPPDCEDAG